MTDTDEPVPFRVFALGYGLLAYLAFLFTVLYYVGFLANVGVPSGIDEGSTGPLVEAVAIDGGLIVLFGLQHSVMARSWFKDRWTRVVPDPIERSTFVLGSALVLLALAWFWRPLPTTIWDVDGPAGWVLWGVFGLGLAIVVLSSCQISHTSLFGLRQVYEYYRGRSSSPPPFQTPGLYRYVRHPLMTGILLWIWATPHMTLGHLLLAGGLTVYVLVGTRLEERTLIDVHGEAYREYRRTVPMLLPRPGTSVDSMSDETGSGQE